MVGRFLFQEKVDVEREKEEGREGREEVERNRLTGVLRTTLELVSSEDQYTGQGIKHLRRLPERKKENWVMFIS